MNTIENIPLEKTIALAMDEPVPNNGFKYRLRSELNSAVLRKSTQARFFSLKLKPALITLTVVAAIALVFLNPKIVSGIRAFLSFIPGIGITQTEPGNYIVNPQEATLMEGVSFQVSKGVATGQNITLLLEVKGLTEEMLFTSDEHSRFPEVVYSLEINQANTLELQEKSARWNGDSGYEIKLVFLATDKNLSRATLSLSHTPFANPDLSPNNITIPIVFKEITDPDFALPVIDIQTTPYLPAPLTYSSKPIDEEVPVLPTEIKDETLFIHFEELYRAEIHHMIQEQDGTILLGRIYWADESAKMPRFSPLSVELKDENGNIIQTSYFNTQDDIPTSTDMWLPWGLKTTQPLVSGKYYLAFNGLTVRVFTDEKIVLPDSIISNSKQPGEYTLDININGIRMSLSEISFSKTTDGSHLSFIVHSDSQVESLTLFHEKLRNMDISQIDIKKFTVNVGFSDVINLTDGSLVITSIDFHLSEAIQLEFLIP